MNRRQTLKLLVSASVGAVALGHWSMGHGAINALMHEGKFEPDEQDAITAIADTFIPKGDFYGALDLGVPVYLLGYFNQCIESEIQENIKVQLKILNSKANSDFGRGFIECTSDQREKLLIAFSKSESEDEKKFFDLMKSQTMHGFQTTREVMTNHYHYRVVPGLYQGCIDINEPSIT